MNLMIKDTLSSMPRLIKIYSTVLHGQEVEVKVYSPGKTRTMSEEVETDEEVQEEIQQVSDDPAEKDLTEILKEIERYVEEQESKEEEDS